MWYEFSSNGGSFFSSARLFGMAAWNTKNNTKIQREAKDNFEAKER